MKDIKDALILALLATGAAAQIQVNIYSDGACQNYMFHYDAPTDNSCFNYAYGNSNSEIIANCPSSNCICTWYTEPNCGGNYNTEYYGYTDIGIANACASNPGGWQSVQCADFDTNDIPPPPF